MSTSKTAADETSKELIYKKLRRSILMGHREGDTRLDVNSIAEEYSTSAL